MCFGDVVFILLAALTNIFLGVGMYRTLGIFVVEIMDVYEATTSRVSLIFTTVAIGFCVSGKYTLCPLLHLIYNQKYYSKHVDVFISEDIFGTSYGFAHIIRNCCFRL